MSALLFETRSALASRFRSFSPAVLEAFALAQYRGWLWRRQFEPSSGSQAEPCAFADLPAKNRAFVMRFAPQLFDCFRFAGRDAIEELLRVGTRLTAPGALAISKGGLQNPCDGIPLADGSLLRTSESLLRRLAIEEHRAWYFSRLWSYLLPPELQQPKNHPSHFLFDEETAEEHIIADMRAIIGFACGLSELDSEHLQVLFESSSTEPLTTSAYVVSFSQDFQDFWPAHFSACEYWRNGRLADLQALIKLSGVGVLRFEQAEGLLDIIRFYGLDAVLELRRVGELLQRVKPVRGLQDHFNPFQGVPLQDGTLVQIEADLLQSLAEEHQLLLRGIRSYYSSFPLRKTQREAERPVSDDLHRDAERIYGFALALATLPPKFWKEVLDNLF